MSPPSPSSWTHATGKVTFFATFLLIGGGFCLPMSGLPIEPWWLFVGAASVVILALVWWKVGEHRWTAHLERHDYCVCVRCGYPLPTGPDAGRCPECGDPYSRAAAAQTWRERLTGAAEKHDS
ncbi:MAG TPA: hypothetical protein VD997_07555 [Phycisphaerales bacterium]|nr:hypothetical protein [Phycisphaerales bacterium]